jgi:hypothetical protein
MDFTQCSIYVEIETADPTEELLTYISGNLNEINDYYILNFIPVYNKNLNDSNYIKNLKDEGVSGLPCMVIYSNNNILDVVEGNRDIINYLMQNSNNSGKGKIYVEGGKIKSSGHITNEDEMHTAMNDLIHGQGEDKEGENTSNNDMEKVKHIAASQGLTDSRFQSAINRARIGRVPFSQINKQRKDKLDSKSNDSRRGERITSGRGTKKKESNKTNTSSDTVIAYRGSESLRSTPMGKIESNKSSLVNDNRVEVENDMKEEADNIYENYVQLPGKKNKMTGSMLMNKLKRNMTVSA